MRNLLLSATLNFAALIKRHQVFLLLSAGYFVSRLIFLNSGFHVLEPDEVLYARMADDFASGRWPLYYGKLYLETFPFFHFAAGLLQYFFPLGKLVGVRLLSLFGAFLVGLGLYQYGWKKKNAELGLWSAGVFWLLPLGFFYSRSGTLEMFYLGWVVLSVVVFANTTKKTSRKLGIWSGILFTLAVLAKTPALVFGLSFALLSVFNKTRYFRAFIWFSLSSFLSLVAILGGYFWYFRQEFLDQASDLPARHLLPLTNIRVHLAVWWEYFVRIPWYFSWPVILMAATGIVFGLTKKNRDKGQMLELSSLALPALLFVALFDFSPRYMAMITPAVALAAAYGLGQLRLRVLRWFVVLLILPLTYLSWQSTLHQGFRELRLELDKVVTASPGLPIYTTVDPDKLDFYLNRDLELLESEATKGAIVIADRRKTELFANFSNPEYVEMKETLDLLTSEQMLWSWEETRPHYPVSELGNTLYLFLIEQEDSD